MQLFVPGSCCRRGCDESAGSGAASPRGGVGWGPRNRQSWRNLRPPSDGTGSAPGPGPWRNGRSSSRTSTSCTAGTNEWNGRRKTAADLRSSGVRSVSFREAFRLRCRNRSAAGSAGLVREALWLVPVPGRGSRKGYRSVAADLPFRRRREPSSAPIPETLLRNPEDVRRFRRKRRRVSAGLQADRPMLGALPKQDPPGRTPSAARAAATRAPGPGALHVPPPRLEGCTNAPQFRPEPYGWSRGCDGDPAASCSSARSPTRPRSR